jgi:hypothetical protein
VELPITKVGKTARSSSCKGKTRSFVNFEVYPNTSEKFVAGYVSTKFMGEVRAKIINLGVAS